jgi:hypothetical protein
MIGTRLLHPQGYFSPRRTSMLRKGHSFIKAHDLAMMETLKSGTDSSVVGMTKSG